MVRVMVRTKIGELSFNIFGNFRQAYFIQIWNNPGHVFRRYVFSNIFLVLWAEPPHKNRGNQLYQFYCNSVCCHHPLQPPINSHFHQRTQNKPSLQYCSLFAFPTIAWTGSFTEIGSRNPNMSQFTNSIWPRMFTTSCTAFTKSIFKGGIYCQ